MNEEKVEGKEKGDETSLNKLFFKNKVLVLNNANIFYIT